MMSDSDGDMGGFGHTTPAKNANSRTRKTVSGSHSKPGPKSKTTGKGKGKGKARAVTEEQEGSDSDIQEISPPDPDQEEEEQREVEESPPPKKRPRRDQSEPRASSSKQPIRSKPAPKSKTKAGGSKQAERTGDEVEIATDADRLSGANGVSNGSERELERMKKKFTEAQADIVKLKKQLEDVLKVRQTEAEQLMEAQRAQHERQIEVKDALIQELQSSLAKTGLLATSGKSGVLHLLTREAADEEKRQLEKNLKHWKDLATQREEAIKEKVQIEKDLRYELKMEVERSKSLRTTSSKTTPIGKSRPGPGVLGTDDPKTTVLVKIYEDLTDLLIVNIKQSNSPYFDLEEWTITCVYTYRSSPHDDTNTRSLSFTLKIGYETQADFVGPPETAADLLKTVRYNPLELNREPKEYVEGLGYLGDAFSFERAQLSLFLTSIKSRIEEALGLTSEQEQSEYGEQEGMSVDEE